MKMWAYIIAGVYVIVFSTTLVAQKNATNSDSVMQAKQVAGETVLTIKRNQHSGIIDSLDKDSLGGKDTILLNKDSVGPVGTFGQPDIDRYKKLLDNPLLPMRAAPRDGYIAFRERANKDSLFYLITLLLFMLAVIRVGFPTYFNRLFRFYFQTSLRQKQTRDRLLADQLAAIGLNLLFFIVMGTYVTLLARWRGWYVGNFWILWSAATGFLCLIYAGKYLFLQLAGWIFNSREAMRSYIFVVFLVNKTAAVLVLPLLILVAFSSPEIVESAFTIGLILIIAAFVYRYAVSFAIIRNKMALNAFHFFLYFMSLEVIPLLIILKLLFRKLNVFV